MSNLTVYSIPIHVRTTTLAGVERMWNLCVLWRPCLYKYEKLNKYSSTKFHYNCDIIRKNCLAVGWVQGKSFLVDVSVEKLDVIYLTLKYCIGFSEREQPSILSQMRYLRARNHIREIIRTVYDQHKSLVLTNKEI